ncbi:phosphoenolpyruvate--protein phosphotransferase [Anaerocolumna xylanovorans]|uniref:Phosphoenolpyruvate-protein phosphotransferase n=1 Tax=Anaerocolumna xylanovorans DSM 12503 TaxID=1121345 RepID=A0A1M7YGM4_9FIRM|nr:phosphoenolpyruvate--protein phosphotransferase [Anaerocolumna xylanovorans]SHO51794.1 phosphotransferase system, enzyme I, PtsI [Anaerocolumna xylanovorans DSM 12503]
MKVLKVNQPASAGIAMGRAALYKPKIRKIAENTVDTNEIPHEIERFKEAVLKAEAQLKELSEANPIFAAHLEMVKDSTLHEAVILKIAEEGQNTEKAVFGACEELITIFGALEDAYMKERAADIKDIRERLLNNLTGVSAAFLTYGEDAILIAKDLTPSDTASLDLSKIKGLITRDGGITSHVAILAKSLSLPALVGVKEIMEEVREEDYLILDGYNGEILINPDGEILDKYNLLLEKHLEENRLKREEESLAGKTTDGREIHLFANVGNTGDVKKAVNFQIDGIGLYRSEFLYLNSSYFPTEEEQFLAYKESALLCGKEITIRTLDIGGDKTLPYFPMEKEDNPFLGWRAIRISLNEKEMFKNQLRAILRASAFGKIKILFPMIISLHELLKAKEILKECMAELSEQGISYDGSIETGVMIETPASVLCAEELAAEADFFSIGTNDLTQYLLAVDRGNAKIAELYNSFHPAVLRSIRLVTQAAHRYGKKAGMCGEFAGNEKATKLLIGLGLDELSMTPAKVADIKYTLRRISYEEAKSLAEEACKQTSAEAVIRVLEEN